MHGFLLFDVNEEMDEGCVWLDAGGKGRVGGCKRYH